MNTPTETKHKVEQQVTTMNTDKIDDEIKTLRERSHKTANDITTQALSIASLEADIKMLAERIPMDLGIRLVRFEMKMDEIGKQLTDDFVKRIEFEVLKVEHEQMKKIIYGFVAIVLLAVVGAVVALVVKQ